jgi:hypothetical protein
VLEDLTNSSGMIGFGFQTQIEELIAVAIGKYFAAGAVERERICRLCL